MFWAMGAIFLQLQAVPQVTVPTTPKAALEASQTAASDKVLLANASGSGASIILEPMPERSVAAAAAALLKLPNPAPIAPVIAAPPPLKPQFSGRIGGGPQKQWLALMIAGHAAATFDAWSTRRAITQHG